MTEIDHSSAPRAKWDTMVTAQFIQAMLEEKRPAAVVVDELLRKLHDATLEKAAQDLDRVRREWLIEKIDDYDEIKSRDYGVHILAVRAKAIREMKTASSGESNLPAWCGTGIETHLMGEHMPTQGPGWYPIAYGYDPIEEGLMEGAMYWSGEAWVKPPTTPFVKFIDEAYSCEDFADSRAHVLEIGS